MSNSVGVPELAVCACSSSSRQRVYFVCSNQLSQEMDNGEPPEVQVSDDSQRASHILQFSAESTPPPKSDDVAEVNGSGKKKSKRPQWFNVRVWSL